MRRSERGEVHPWLAGWMMLVLLVGVVLWLGLALAPTWLRWRMVGVVGVALAIIGTADLVRAVRARHRPPPGIFEVPAPTVVGALIILAGALVALGLGVVHAQTGGCGFLSGGNLGACLKILPPPDPAGPTAPGGPSAPNGPDQPSGPSNPGGPSDPSPYRWERHYWGTPGDPGFANNSPFLCGKNPDGSDQLPYTDVLIDTRDGSEVRRQNGCQGIDDPATPANEGAPAPPPPPPPPPSAGEVLDAIPLPDPAFGISPAQGLTGAKAEAMTALWDENGSAPRSVSVTIRGYVVTATASPSEWEWDMLADGPTSTRNPGGILHSNAPGTRDDPAARYTYFTEGDYRITLTVTWGGSFTFSGNGVPSETRPLGTTTQESSTGYHVLQIRPALEARAT